MNRTYDCDAKVPRQPSSNLAEEAQHLALELPVPDPPRPAREEKGSREPGVGLRILGQGMKGKPREQWLAGQHPATEQVLRAGAVDCCKLQVGVAHQVDEMTHAAALMVAVLVMRRDRRPVQG